MTMPKALTDEQIEQFRRDGFLIHGPLLNPDELEEMREAIDRLAAGEGSPEVVRNLELSAQEDGLAGLSEKDRYWQLLRMAAHDPVIGRHVRRKCILDVVEDLLGTEDIKFFADQTMLKPGRHGSRISWHQDSAYWTRVEPPALVSCWVALDDVTTENGCMYMLPGTHKQGVVPFLAEEREGVKGRLHVRDLDLSAAVPLTMAAGSCSFHHSCVIHGSGPNTTSSPRRAVISSYMRADSRHVGSPEEQPEYPLLRGLEHPGCV